MWIRAENQSWPLESQGVQLMLTLLSQFNEQLKSLKKVGKWWLSKSALSMKTKKIL